VREKVDFGFTGSQYALPQVQIDGLVRAMKSVAEGYKDHQIRWHHGDCINADETSHHIARELGFHIISHPPSDESKRAFTVADEVRDPKPYMERNEDIALESEQGVIAAPRQHFEVVRSGTWSTVRRARKLDRPVLFVWPDGDLEWEVR